MALLPIKGKCRGWSCIINHTKLNGWCSLLFSASMWFGMQPRSSTADWYKCWWFTSILKKKVSEQHVHCNTEAVTKRRKRNKDGPLFSCKFLILEDKHWETAQEPETEPLCRSVNTHQGKELFAGWSEIAFKPVKKKRMNERKNERVAADGTEQYLTQQSERWLCK